MSLGGLLGGSSSSPAQTTPTTNQQMSNAALQNAQLAGKTAAAPQAIPGAAEASPALNPNLAAGKPIQPVGQVAGAPAAMGPAPQNANLPGLMQNKLPQAGMIGQALTPTINRSALLSALVGGG